MRECPFCNFDEGWSEKSPSNPGKFVIRCKVCGAIGPESDTYEGAERKWNGSLKDVDADDKGAFQLALDEDVMGPISTLGNTPGMGNAQPPSTTNMSTSGSGDKWTTDSSLAKQNESFYPSIYEENINPYDKVGTAMAKKMKVPMTFKKGKKGTVKQKRVSK